MPIVIAKTDVLNVADFQQILCSSGLAERRPIDDVDRLAKMLRHSNLIVIAHDQATQQIVGVARSVTDFAYCCYLSDLAVTRDYQGQGIGSALIDKTRELAGPESMCLLVSAPSSVGFYEKIGMPAAKTAFMYKREW